MTRTASQSRTAAAIRSEFIEYFREREHAFAPSSPVVPHDDPTLLFTNAGMNQFKDVFLGTGRRDYARAVNSQKCIRAGGKHNDLEDVGKDHYHHTFFEMLGNWSFGDYFKAEAIDWAWDLLVNRWGLDADRLYATVFEGDSNDGTEPDVDAEQLWLRHLPADRVSRWGKKDNFWEMGESGPCGPCSELHYDCRTDEERAARPGHELVNRDHPDVIEIWNLVFIEFNRDDQGVLTPLPARHVDTGMGLERLARILQDRRSNYDTDLWTPVFDAISEHTGAHPYQGSLDDPVDVAYRVIADHARCLTVAIADGANPSNEGRGYVLRRILRRAVRHAHQTLATRGPWLHEIVPAVVTTLSSAFPELSTAAERVSHVIREEEESFLRTLDRGIELFEEAAGRARDGRLAAEDAFRLHDTYGFPVDLTRVMAEERGLAVDEAGYERLMDEARARSRQGGGDAQRTLTLSPDAIAHLESSGVAHTDDEHKFRGRPTTATIRAIWDGKRFEETLEDLGRAPVALITDRTCFYAEQGGQVGDRGEIRDVDADRSTFVVEDTQVVGGYVLHIGHLARGRVQVGESASMTIDRHRRTAIRANHTATHLLNLALRDTLVDEQVDQRGSLVADDRLRFDFSCGRAVAADEIERLQALVNERIADDLEVFDRVVALDDARSIRTLRAVFGERYPDPVRVVSIGRDVETLLADPAADAWQGLSVELCGGTHLARTSEAESFVVTQEQALASGVRRIVALTGAAARAADLAGGDLETRATAALELEGEALVAEADELSRLVDELTIGVDTRHRVKQAIEPVRKKARGVLKESAAVARTGVVEQARALAEGADGEIIVDALEGADKETLMSAVDVVKAKRPDAAAMLFGTSEGKVAIVAIVPKPVIARGL
jgi:alanyl-tRNA synthetase